MIPQSIGFELNAHFVFILFKNQSIGSVNCVLHLICKDFSNSVRDGDNEAEGSWWIKRHDLSRKWSVVYTVNSLVRTLVTCLGQNFLETRDKHFNVRISFHISIHQCAPIDWRGFEPLTKFSISFSKKVNFYLKLKVYCGNQNVWSSSLPSIYSEAVSISVKSINATHQTCRIRRWCLERSKTCR